MSNFIVQALKGDDISLYGDGQQTRIFCYVDDLIEGFVRFMGLPEGEGGAPGFPAPVNLGNPNGFTIKQLAEKDIELTGSASSLVHKPLPTDDPMQRQADVSVAREKLNDWLPEVQLLVGLRHTIFYFDALLTEGG